MKIEVSIRCHFHMPDEVDEANILMSHNKGMYWRAVDNEDKSIITFEHREERNMGEGWKGLYADNPRGWIIRGKF